MLGSERSLYAEQLVSRQDTRRALGERLRLYRGDFKLLENCRLVPFGDAAALERVLADDRSIGTFILETIQGGAGIVLPPEGYLRAVRELCDRYGVLWIADEVQCGYGRTGRSSPSSTKASCPTS